MLSDKPELKVLWVKRDGVASDEFDWHQKWASQRHRNEWFRLTRLLFDTIKESIGNVAPCKLMSDFPCNEAELKFATESIYVDPAKEPA